MPVIRTLVFALALIAVSPSRGADPPPNGMAFEVYIRLEHGMTEGELVLRAGKPDHQVIENYRDGHKSLYYYPTTANPYLTTVSLRNGRIVNIERIRKPF